MPGVPGHNHLGPSAFSPSSCPWAGRGSTQQLRGLLTLFIQNPCRWPCRVCFCVFCLFVFSSEVRSGQPFRESDLESFFVYTLLHLIENRSTTLRKLLKWKKKWRSGRIWVSKLFHYRNRINNQQQLFLVNMVNLHYNDAPLKIVEWIFTFDFRIWSII